MLVTTMNEVEAIKEISEDLPSLMRYIDHQEKDFRRMVIKATKFPVYQTIEYVSPRKNRWIAIHEARNKSMYFDRCIVTFFVTYNAPGGLYAILVTLYNGAAKYVFYCPHFFSRYAERMDLNLTGIDLLKCYFKRNANYVFTRKHPDVVGTAQDGIALGFETEYGNFMFKTFVSNEMLKGEQVGDFLLNNNFREEYQQKQLEADLKEVKNA